MALISSRMESVIVLRPFFGVFIIGRPGPGGALERAETAGHGIDALQSAHDAPPRARLLGRNAAGVYAGARDRSAHHREAGDRDVVADRQMPHDASHAADHAALAHGDTARKTDAGGHRRVRA